MNKARVQEDIQDIQENLEAMLNRLEGIGIDFEESDEDEPAIKDPHTELLLAEAAKLRAEAELLQVKMPFIKNALKLLMDLAAEKKISRETALRRATELYALVGFPVLQEGDFLREEKQVVGEAQEPPVEVESYPYPIKLKFYPYPNESVAQFRDRCAHFDRKLTEDYRTNNLAGSTERSIDEEREEHPWDIIIEHNCSNYAELYERIRAVLLEAEKFFNEVEANKNKPTIIEDVEPTREPMKVTFGGQIPEDVIRLADEGVLKAIDTLEKRPLESVDECAADLLIENKESSKEDLSLSEKVTSDELSPEDFVAEPLVEESRKQLAAIKEERVKSAKKTEPQEPIQMPAGQYALGIHRVPDVIEAPPQGLPVTGVIESITADSSDFVSARTIADAAQVNPSVISDMSRELGIYGASSSDNHWGFFDRLIHGSDHKDVNSHWRYSAANAVPLLMKACDAFKGIRNHLPKKTRDYEIIPMAVKQIGWTPTGHCDKKYGERAPTSLTKSKKSSTVSN